MKSLFYFRDNMPSHFKFKDYCPNVFRNIREQFGVEQYDYLISMTSFEPEYDHVESVSSGGSRLFTSFDKKFVVKVECLYWMKNFGEYPLQIPRSILGYRESFDIVINYS